jgi:hypothetical protein
MSDASITCNLQTEEVPENDDFQEGAEEEEVEIDDEFEDIEEEGLEENNNLVSG